MQLGAISVRASDGCSTKASGKKSAGGTTKALTATCAVCFEPLAESESEQLRQRVVLVWEVMLVLAAAYCAHRTCSRRCAGGKSAHEVGAKRIAL